MISQDLHLDSVLVFTYQCSNQFATGMGGRRNAVLKDVLTIVWKVRCSPSTIADTLKLKDNVHGVWNVIIFSNGVQFIIISCLFRWPLSRMRERPYTFPMRLCRVQQTNIEARILSKAWSKGWDMWVSWLWKSSYSQEEVCEMWSVDSSTWRR